MKNRKHLLEITGILIVFLMVLISCSNTKRAAVPCPDFSGRKTYKGTSKKIAENDKEFLSHWADRKILNTVRRFNSSGTNPLNHQADLTDYQVQAYITAIDTDRVNRQLKMEYLNNLTASINPSLISSMKRIPVATQNISKPTLSVKAMVKSSQTACDSIILKPGNIITGKILEIGLSEIKYRECENLDGPVISILKSDVFVIKYPNGTRDYFNSEVPVSSGSSVNMQKTEGLGLAGFIASLVGLFVLGIPLGLLAVIFGIISQGKLKRNPGKYKGRGFARASIIIGMIDVIGMIILLSLM
jgi:hypothetical protein